MLEVGKQYRNNSGELVTIGGKVRHYSSLAPFMWSLSGDWFDEDSGAFVITDHFGVTTLSKAHPGAVSNHKPVNPGQLGVTME